MFMVFEFLQFCLDPFLYFLFQFQEFLLRKGSENERVCHGLDDERGTAAVCRFFVAGLKRFFVGMHLIFLQIVCDSIFIVIKVRQHDCRWFAFVCHDHPGTRDVHEQLADGFLQLRGGDDLNHI